MKTNSYSRLSNLILNITNSATFGRKTLSYNSLSSEQVSDFIKKIPKDNLKENYKKEDFLLTEENKLYENINTKVKDY